MFDTSNLNREISFLTYSFTILSCFLYILGFFFVMWTVGFVFRDLHSYLRIFKYAYSWIFKTFMEHYKFFRNMHFSVVLKL